MSAVISIERGAQLASWRSRSVNFFEELRQRKVLRAVAAYAAAAWILLQIGEVTFEPMGVPVWVMSLLIVLVIAMLPLVVVVAWFFDLTTKGFRRTTARMNPAPAGRATSSQFHAPSIAVLPFDDMSPEQDQAYLCDGIAEEILNRLARIKKLDVVSRTASFRFKGSPTDAVSIGEKLKVATVLEGSVRKDGNHLRVSTELINVGSGFHLWSQSYDRKLEHIFEIEDEIASHVADELQVTLGTQLAEDRFTTGNAKAYEYYLKGLHYFRRWGPKNMSFATDMFHKAVQGDPGYARAWAALADCYAMLCMYWNSSAENRRAADLASRKALELLPGLAEVHVSRGLSHIVGGQEAEAIVEFETALSLDPDSFDAHYFYGRVRFQRGEMREAAALFEKAEWLREDDFQAPIFLRQVYRSLGLDQEAYSAALRGLERAQQHVELNPDDTRALNFSLAGLVEIGDIEKAMHFAERALEIDGENPDTLYNVACGFALAGEADRALDCLERASLHGMSIAKWAENDSDLKSLRDHPRFSALIHKLKQGQVEQD